MIPLLAISAWSGTGKTTLLKLLIPELKSRGIRCGLIKHTHHQMEVDTPGKDSDELRKAGADQVMVASELRWALMTETPQQNGHNLHYFASRMNASELDLILVEGFKHEEVAKIVLHRSGTGKQLPLPLDQWVIAVASDIKLELSVVRLDLNNTVEIADFIESWMSAKKA
ncbi:molybdopterin-guanine dinucleotide biosynthesis protein MobB [Erwiniaceae bacterium CAU 1747]